MYDLNRSAQATLDRLLRSKHCLALAHQKSITGLQRRLKVYSNDKVMNEMITMYDEYNSLSNAADSLAKRINDYYGQPKQ